MPVKHPRPEPQKARPYLERTPVEVLSLIQCQLNPLDIISLRKTCKQLASNTSDIMVWRKALIHVLDTHGVFRPTFPILQMSQKELEHAALAPSRFASLMNSDGPFRPFVTRLHKARDLLDPLKDRKFKQYFLVPGGRFLITTSGNSIVELWDLGYSPNSMIKPFPVASFVKPSRRLTIVNIQPAPDGMGIQTLLEVELAQGVQFCVCRVYPEHSSPQFAVVGALTHQMVTVKTSTFRGNLFAFEHDNGFVTVWNFIDNSTATWIVNETYYSVNRDFDNYILCFDESFSTLWEIPPLLRRTADDEPLGPTLIQEQPIFVFAHPRRDIYDNTMISSDGWTQDHARPEFLTVFCHKDTNCTIEYYALKPTIGEGVPKFMPIHMVTSENEYTSELTEPGRAQICHDKFIQFWLFNDEVGVHAFEFPHTRTGQVLGAKRILWVGPPETAVESFEFCPVSGRLCCAMLDDCELRIMDFIVPV